jgi:hypothetical protein
MNILRRDFFAQRGFAYSILCVVIVDSILLMMSNLLLGVLLAVVFCACFVFLVKGLRLSVLAFLHAILLIVVFPHLQSSVPFGNVALFVLQVIVGSVLLYVTYFVDSSRRRWALAVLLFLALFALALLLRGFVVRYSITL